MVFRVWPALIVLMAAAPPPSLTIDVKDAQVVNVLRLVAEVGQRDLVVADGISGKLTVKLRGVPWQQVLDVVTESQGLAYEMRGRIIFVDTAKNFLKRAQQNAALRVTAHPTHPQTRVVPVSHARAEELAPLLRAMLGKGSQVLVDKRTNSLVITVR